MIYSRWGPSRWYTFWANRDDETRDNALFEVCSIVTFTAAELRDKREWCLRETKRLAELQSGWPVKDEEFDELRGYMLNFVADVDTHYLERGRDEQTKT